jgi:microsomal dipeptidase-like Zn-dependent dipeptidase
VLRKYLKAERGISQSQLQAVADSGGILGLMPSTQLLQGTPGNTGMDQLTAQYLEISQTLPAKSIFLGSDTNGGIPHLDEYWNIGQAPTLWGALKERGAKIPEPRRQMVNHFIEAWLRVFARQ